METTWSSRKISWAWWRRLLTLLMELLKASRNFRLFPCAQSEVRFQEKMWVKLESMNSTSFDWKVMLKAIFPGAMSSASDHISVGPKTMPKFDAWEEEWGENQYTNTHTHRHTRARTHTHTHTHTQVKRVRAKILTHLANVHPSHLHSVDIR